ncbi:MAG: SLBB domain-containing protein [Spirochaetales bacterium]|nr:SLBB domain-containing protein [Spirochaetales bacterium]
MKKKIILAIIMLGVTTLAFSEINSAGAGDSVVSNEKRILLANSATDYPVTPGDVFQLSYYTANGLQQFEFVIRGNSLTNVSFFGKIDTTGMTYLSLSEFLEKKVTAAYRDSRPECRLVATGIFYVVVTGEVKKTVRVECWGLSRLEDIVLDCATEYTSLREIEVKDKAGKSSIYDLFLAERLGDLSQNPFVRAGDTIILKKTDRRVTLDGEVLRPGVYQLKPNEGLKELVSLYGDGITESGDLSRVRIVRSKAGGEYFGQTLYVDATAANSDKTSLENLDMIFIPDRMETVPVVYVEGAVKNTSSTSSSQKSDSGKFIHRFSEGEYVSTLVKMLEKDLLPDANLKDAYIIRISTNETIPVDLEQLVYGGVTDTDVSLKPYDRVMIPLRQFFVTVSGAVRIPGRYAYVPNRNYQYYLNLAGGTDPEKNSGEKVFITNAKEEPQPLHRPIEPEDKVYAEYNNALYHVNQWSFVITTAVSVTALVVSIMQLSK